MATRWRSSFLALKAEFDVMLQLRHPHVLQMIGFASDGVSNCGLLMELMEANLNDVLYAPTFAQYNSWEGSLLVLATDVARGMAYLHKQSVLHCDLKPANILISAQWVGKVADFGQSWQLEATAATATAAAAEPSGGGGADSRGLHGTPPYMAPEVVIGAVTPSSGRLVVWLRAGTHGDAPPSVLRAGALARSIRSSI